MKKITAIVLALVMVFAFAGSALALTNRQPVVVTPSASSKVLLDLQLISYITGLPTTAGSVINWASINTEANAYLEGQAIYFNCQVNQGAAADVAATDVISTLFKANNNNLNIAGTGVDLSLASISQFNTSSFGVLSAVSAPVVTGKTVAGFNTVVTDDVDAGDYIYNYTFNGVVTAAAPVVKATLTIGPGYEAVAGGPAVDVYSDAVSGVYPVAYTVAKSADSLTYTVTKTGSYAVIFTLKTVDGLLDTIQYVDGVNPAVPVTRVVNVGGTTNWAFGGVANTTFAANLDATLAFFGFDYTLNGLIWDIDFLARANFELTDTVNVKTATATINTGDSTDVPVTGDSASVFGFVMIGVAIIAAASLAVVAKKAR